MGEKNLMNGFALDFFIEQFNSTATNNVEAARKTFDKFVQDVGDMEDVVSFLTVAVKRDKRFIRTFVGPEAIQILILDYLVSALEKDSGKSLQFLVDDVCKHAFVSELQKGISGDVATDPNDVYKALTALILDELKKIRGDRKE